MAGCPSCGRPVALARPQCLYCGAALPPELSAGAGASAAEKPDVPASDRVMLLLDLDAADPAALAGALGLPAFEAAQRARRGGLQLHRVAPPGEAADEAARLLSAGVLVVSLPEAEAQASARPLRARGGQRSGGALLLRAAEQGVHLDATEILLVVRGPIARERQASPEDVRRIRMAAPGPGYRIHLHRRSHPRPIEIDPFAFEFGAGPRVSPSSLVELATWIETVAPGAPVDDEFKRVPPALAPAAPGEEPGAVLGGKEPGAGEAGTILDNLEQFRSYSALRACLARRRP